MGRITRQGLIITYLCSKIYVPLFYARQPARHRGERDERWQKGGSNTHTHCTQPRATMTDKGECAHADARTKVGDR